MPHDVTDVRSNPQDQIAHAARVVGRSEHRRKVFIAIHTGKKRAKTVAEIVSLTSLPRKRVLEEAVKLCNNRIVGKTKVGHELAYERDPFYLQNKEKILRLAGNPNALKEYPTKTNPRIEPRHIVIKLPRDSFDVVQLTVDDIDSLSEVKAEAAAGAPYPIDEKAFKEGLQTLLKEEGRFEDWGGEVDDLYSTRVVVGGTRKSTAFGLKGKGTSGPLVPKKMGKRGDQIQRLFRAPAQVFLIQYWSQIDESIIEQMKSFAIAKSVAEGRRIYYGVIDGADTLRIIRAYSKAFPRV
jgi:hypothetical protein